MSGTARTAPDDTGPLTAIRRQYPGWHPWRSNVGRFWAARIGTLPRSYPARFAMTVDGDTPDELREAIAEQEHLVDTG